MVRRMANPLYQQIGPKTNNNMLQQILNFKKTIPGNPQELVQNLINSGRISQSQVNQCVQQANQIYRQFKGLI